MQKTNKRFSLKKLYTWHRYLGINAAIFVIFLSLTGILLNHGHELKLDNTTVQSSAILALYNIHHPDKLEGFHAADNWLSQWEKQIYFNHKPLGHSELKLQGAVSNGLITIIASTEEIWLLTTDGEIIEKLTAPAEKLGDIKAIGINADKQIVIRTTRGMFAPDVDFVSWRDINKHSHINWSQQQTIATEISEKIFAQTHSITWERFLLDLHSGRIAGNIGVYLIDLIAIILIILAITGLSIWLLKKR